MKELIDEDKIYGIIIYFIVYNIVDSIFNFGFFFYHSFPFSLPFVHLLNPKCKAYFQNFTSIIFLLLITCKYRSKNLLFLVNLEYSFKYLKYKK